MSAEIDLGEALDAIVAALAAKFPTFKTVAAEDESRVELEIPALIVQLNGLEPEPERDPHTGQLAVRVRVEARVVMGHRTEQVRREGIKAAAAVAVFANQNRFGIAWGAAEVIGVDPDDFAPSADKLDIWLVEWGHLADLGSSFFVNEGVTPSEVFTGWGPNVGPDNLAAYQAEDV
jgi:hypothetical protein